MTLEFQGRTIDDDEIHDLLSTIPELQAEVSRYKKVLRSIASLCNAPHWWTAERRWKIEALASGREKP
jgi:hypothetical protein